MALRKNYKTRIKARHARDKQANRKRRSGFWHGADEMINRSKAGTALIGCLKSANGL
jgi:hypothetical protein